MTGVGEESHHPTSQSQLTATNGYHNLVLTSQVFTKQMTSTSFHFYLKIVNKRFLTGLTSTLALGT